ncbi:hypothetical protein BOSE46_110025 [Bosea sp. 46]|nr:hypothetical protein BOSE46_110025 [Bosea sp. 46]VXB78905.1 hypothetical protein BOSE125_150173 [Bosea sp. 125]
MRRFQPSIDHARDKTPRSSGDAKSLHEGESCRKSTGNRTRASLNLQSCRSASRQDASGAAPA